MANRIVSPTATLASWAGHCKTTTVQPAFMLVIERAMFDNGQMSLVGPDGPVNDQTACLILGEALNEVRRRVQDKLARADGRKGTPGRASK